MNRFSIEISDEEIRHAVLQRIAEGMEWSVRNDIEKGLKEYFKTVDQVELNKHITRVLIAKTLGEMK